MAEETWHFTVRIDDDASKPDGSVKIIKQDEETAIVGGYGVIFGGKDLVGETFTPATDFMLDAVPSKVVTYDHAMNEPIKHFIGKTIREEIDEKGIWVEAQLDKAKDYVAEVLKLVEDGALGWSSGSIGHLVQLQESLIKRWPIFEYALTPTPAEPRTLSAERIKALQEQYPDIALLKSEDAGSPSGDASSIEASSKSDNKSKLEVKEMTDEMKEVEETPKEQESLDAGAVAAAVADALKPEIKEMVGEEMKAFVGSLPAKQETLVAPNVMKNAHLGDPDPVEDFYNWVATGKSKIKQHTNHAAELPVTEFVNGVKSVRNVKAALQEGADDEGGYLVPAGELGRIVAKRDEIALLPRVGASQFTTDRDVFNIPTEGTALTKFTIVAEEGAVSAAQNEPTFGQVAVTIYKFMKVIKLSAEIDEDYNSGLAGFLADAIARAWAITENYYVQVGTGSSQPQGVFVGGTAGLTLDSASAIGASEVPELIGKLKQQYRPGAVMLWNRTTGAYLAGLTGNPFQFRQNPISNLTATGEDMGIGYPVIQTEDAAAIGASAKSMLFGNFALYGWVRNRSLRVERMNELYKGNDQIGLHAKFRAGGMVLQAEALQYATHPTG